MATPTKYPPYVPNLATFLPGVDLPHVGPAWDFSHGPLRVSADQRSIEHADGTPFLWLGDTAWELFHRCDRAEVEWYLEQRRSQGFTVIQAVALAEFDGIMTPNVYGARPLVDQDPGQLLVSDGHDPTQPKAYDYWDHIDYVFAVAAQKGLTIAFLPTWGDKIPSTTQTPNWGCGPQVFTVANARLYGRALANRYSHWPNLIWVNGGDRAGDMNVAVWNALAAGIQEVDQGRHLMTYHPNGGASSRQWFVEEPWHAFSMVQTGHLQNTDVWNRLTTEWDAVPTRPVINGEPTYEAIPFNYEPDSGYATDHDTRKFTYWSLFSGAFGHTYGCHPIWQFYAPGRDPGMRAKPGLYWKSVDGSPGAIHLPGAWSILNTRRLLLSRPMAGRVPDPEFLLNNPSNPGEHQVATRAKDGSWAMAYSPAGLPITVDLARLPSTQVRAWWFDPRRGTSHLIGEFQKPEGGPWQMTFVPPATTPDCGRFAGNDAIVVLDAVDPGYPPPGAVPSMAPA